MEITEDIEGIFDREEVYALFPSLDGQDKAICPMTKEEILIKLNNELDFLKNNPKYKTKGMIGLIINCEGKVVQCKMDNLSGSKELDKQIELIFNSIGVWEPGKLNVKNVDSSELFSFKIKKGKLKWS